MPNETYYRRFLPSDSSISKSGPFNTKQTKNTRAHLISTDNINTSLGKTSNIIESRVVTHKKKNSLRIAKNRRRIELLSQPKLRIQTQNPKSSSPAAEANKNKDDDDQVKKFNGNDLLSVSRSYRILTPRLLQLAQPKVYDSPSYNLNESGNGCMQKSIVTKISERIEELALPKRIQLHTNKDPFKVNPKALNASCPSRVKELARPKRSSQPFSQLIQDYLNRAYVGPI